jgi:hypothetical protein
MARKIFTLDNLRTMKKQCCQKGMSLVRISGGMWKGKPKYAEDFGAVAELCSRTRTVTEICAWAVHFLPVQPFEQRKHLDTL